MLLTKLARRLKSGKVARYLTFAVVESSLIEMGGLYEGLQPPGHVCRSKREAHETKVNTAFANFAARGMRPCGFSSIDIVQRCEIFCCIAFLLDL